MAFDNAHYLLAAALKKLPPEQVPPGPYHGGGPQPKFDGYGYLRAGLWLAERARPLVEARDLETFERWVALAQKQLAAGQGLPTRLPELREADVKKVRRVPLRMGIWAACEADYFATRSIYTGTAARFAAPALARHLADVQPAALAGFLKDLDALCLHLELLSLLRDRDLQVSAEPEHTLWRGHDGKRVTHWIARLSPERYVLVRKLGPRWTAIEGCRDDVLASVDDASFGAAVAAALG